VLENLTGAKPPTAIGPRDTMEQAKERVRNWTSGPLDLSTLGLTELPELPAGLTTLYCSENQITRLPETLPADLQLLNCMSNQLTTLPKTLPIGITIFTCSNNNFPDIEDDETIPDYVARVNAIAEAASQERIVARCGLVFEELAKKVWHPLRVERLMLAGVDMEDM